METMTLLMNGFASAMTIPNLVACFIGCFLGTIVGVLPGIGPSATIALMLPISVYLSPSAALIMMLGVFSGAQYGGTITAVLVNVPGEASSVMTAVDGYPLAKQGRGGVAMVLCQVGSFIGGNLSVLGLMLVAMPLADFALKFGSPENFSVIFFALIVATALVSESLVRGLIGLIIGLIVATIGTDVQTGVPRLTIGLDALLDGIDNVVVIIGIFGIGEVLWYAASADEKPEAVTERLGAGRWMPNAAEWRAGWWPMIRGSVIGFVTGVLAAGPSLASFTSYSVEKRMSKHPETFGKGALEGITACESSNNATTGGTLIPLFTLGIPHTGSLAILMSVMIMYGLRPGPMLMIQQAPLMWTIIASLYIGNVMLLIMNLPAVGLFIKILDIPMKYLMPMIIVMASLGTYSLNQQMTDVALTIVFGVIGFALRWGGFTPVGLVLGMVLGDKLEHFLRSAILISGYDFTIFFTKPISLFFLLLTAAVLTVDIVTRRKGRAAEDSEK